MSLIWFLKTLDLNFLKKPREKKGAKIESIPIIFNFSLMTTSLIYNNFISHSNSINLEVAIDSLEAQTGISGANLEVGRPIYLWPTFLGSDAQEVESLYADFEMWIRYWISEGRCTYGVAEFDSNKGAS